MTAFSLAGLALVLLMFALSFTVATAQEVVTRMADVGAAVVKRWGGRVLVGVGLWLIVLALGANVFARFFPVHPEAQGQMPGMGASGNPTPPVKGFAKGQEVRFIHTEASDPQVAEMLTRMMGPKVLVVPSLKEIPDRLLATVFVFRNGVKGEGPMGFQPDVFDTVPGELGYTPLRRVGCSSPGKRDAGPGSCAPQRRSVRQRNRERCNPQPQGSSSTCRCSRGQAGSARETE